MNSNQTPVEPTPTSVEPVDSTTPEGTDPDQVTTSSTDGDLVDESPVDQAPAEDGLVDPGAEEWQAYPGEAGAFAGYPGGGTEVAVDVPPEATERPDGTTMCPGCDNAIERWASYCEICGQTLTPTAPMPKAPAPSGSVATRPSLRRTESGPPKHPCAECGGAVGDDLYCQQCGAKAPTPRDHFREAPASWVAGVCDRGIRHQRNEDGMALAADQEPGSQAVLIVCDGVSNAQDSHIASLAAARTARGVLIAERPAASDDAAARVAALQETIAEAARQANTAVIERTESDSTNPPSCTYAVALVDGNTVVYGNLGDSRVYWIADDPADSVQLSIDDSVAQARIAMGIDRVTAENGPQAHAITKWLGRDAPEVTPTTGSYEVTGGGWVMVCSDGLWNYASTAEELGGLVHEAIGRNAGNRRVRSLAVSLVRWARQQGGKDNITVALARLGDFATEDADQADPADEGVVA